MRLNEKEKEKIKKNIEYVSEIVLDVYGIKYNKEIYNSIINSRMKKDVEIKDTIVYILHDYFKWSHLNITEFFFTCNRATQKSVYKIRAYLKYDPIYLNRFKEIEKKITA